MNEAIETGLSPAVEEERISWPAKATALSVLTDDQYREAAAMLLGIKVLGKKIDDFCDPNIKRWHDGHTAALAEKKTLRSPLNEAEVIIKAKMIACDAERQRQADEEARRLKLLAIQAEERERLDKAAAIEIEAAATGDETLFKEALLVLETPMPVVAAYVAPHVTAVQGVSRTGRWSARVVSLIALVKFVVKNPQYVNALEVNQVFLDAQARSMQKNLQIDGVQAVFTPGISAIPSRMAKAQDRKS